jgi:hypothetical protein
LRFWLVLISLIAAVWIYFDGKKRGINPLFWSVATFLVIFFLPLYLIFRPKGRLINCIHCGKEKLESIICPFCGDTKDVFVICPSCQYKNSPGSLNCKRCGSKI